MFWNEDWKKVCEMIQKVSDILLGTNLQVKIDLGDGGKKSS